MTAQATPEEETPPPINESEDLGRGVFSRRDARAAERGQIRATVFLERPGAREMSVDRLTLSPSNEAVAIADAAAAGREGNRSFYGWAVITVAEVIGVGCVVVASPLQWNPYHADIVLPESAVDEWEQRQYALELAARARWLGRPE